MNNSFNQTLRTWLETPEELKDYAAGNVLLLQLSGNKIRYNNFSRNLERNKIHINYQLQKYYNFRVQNMTKEEVKAMSKKAEKIAENAKKEVKKEAKKKKSTAKKNALPELVKGMRPDHQKLPEDIQALYERNRVVIREIQENHLQLRKLSLTDAPCPDSDRYPFLKEMIKLDKEYHDNWTKYDNFKTA